MSCISLRENFVVFASLVSSSGRCLATWMLNSSSSSSGRQEKNHIEGLVRRVTAFGRVISFWPLQMCWIKTPNDVNVGRLAERFCLQLNKKWWETFKWNKKINVPLTFIYNCAHSFFHVIPSNFNTLWPKFNNFLNSVPASPTSHCNINLLPAILRA
jgi:hypothetical protein